MKRPLVIVIGPDLDDGALAVVNHGDWTYNVHPVYRLDNPYTRKVGHPTAFAIGPEIESRTAIPAPSSPPPDTQPDTGALATVHLAEAVETAAEILADLLEEEPTL